MYSTTLFPDGRVKEVGEEGELFCASLRLSSVWYLNLSRSMVKEATVREEEAGKRVSNFQATLKALAKYSDFKHTTSIS